MTGDAVRLRELLMKNGIIPVPLTSPMDFLSRGGSRI
jgi:hypothetical protein